MPGLPSSAQLVLLLGHGGERQQEEDGEILAPRRVSAACIGLLKGSQASLRYPEVRAYWPDGTIEEWRDLRRNTYHTLRAGTGQRVQ